MRNEELNEGGRPDGLPALLLFWFLRKAGEQLKEYHKLNTFIRLTALGTFA